MKIKNPILAETMNKKNDPAVPAHCESFPSRKKTLAIMVSAVLGTAPALQAADLALEEIIVTASKRKANLQDLPQAITAFTTADIERQGFAVLDDYANSIPSLAFARREPAGTSIVFRGVAASGIQYGTNPSSSVYLDESPITQAGLNPDPRLIDIERVEALSGPQGTLFGDASQSGTLRIITNKADPSAMEGWIEGDVGAVAHSNDTDRDVSGMVNIPLIQDKLAIRLVGFESHEAGYIDNVLVTSQPDRWEDARIASGYLPVSEPFDNAGNVNSDVNSTRTVGGRAAVRWLVNDDWTVDAAGIVQNTDADGFGDVDLGLGTLQQGRFENEDLKDNWYMASLSLEGNLGFADTVLTGSYFNRNLTYEADATDYQHGFDQEFNPVYYAIYDFSGEPRGYVIQNQKDERWTVEGRMTTPADSDSRWSGVVGFFYGKLKRTQFNTSTIRNFSDTQYYANQGYSYLNDKANSPYYNPNYATFHNSATDNWFFGAYDLHVEQTALFGEVTFAATEKLSFTGGARWFNQDQELLLQQGNLLAGNRIDVQSDYLFNNEVKHYSQDDWVPKLNVTYQLTDDVLTYATYSEGFRSGGTNALRANSVLPEDYDPDKLKNYELGLKSEWFDSSLRFNAVAYHMQWNDIQIQVNDPTIFSLGIINFSQAEIDGFESEVTWIPAAGWEINANMAVINAQISENNTIYTPDGEQLIAQVDKGTQLPIAPKKKGTISVQYTFQRQLLQAEPFVLLEWAYVGDSVNSLDGTESIIFTQGATDQPSYDLGNLRMGLDAPQWSATLYVTNITDEVAEQFFNNRWGTPQRVTVNKPRTVGSTCGGSFDAQSRGRSLRHVNNIVLDEEGRLNSISTLALLIPDSISQLTPLELISMSQPNSFVTDPFGSFTSRRPGPKLDKGGTTVCQSRQRPAAFAASICMPLHHVVRKIDHVRKGPSMGRQDRMLGRQDRGQCRVVRHAALLDQELAQLGKHQRPTVGRRHQVVPVVHQGIQHRPAVLLLVLAGAGQQLLVKIHLGHACLLAHETRAQAHDAKIVQVDIQLAESHHHLQIFPRVGFGGHQDRHLPRPQGGPGHDLVLRTIVRAVHGRVDQHRGVIDPRLYIPIDTLLQIFNERPQRCPGQAHHQFNG
ncbi:MAG: TonB-dependent receptor [Halioglobus sp.]